jgi:hypothetical protein
MSKTKTALRIIALALPMFYFIFLVADRNGLWSHLSGLDKVESVAARFERSYSADASHPVSLGDPEWKPLVKLVYKYSNADLPQDKQPQTVARFPATISDVSRTPNGEILSEWTAPSTPLVLLFRRWPGQDVPKNDWVIVGTIGDLRTWILRDKDDLRFWVKDVFFMLTSFVIGLLLFVHERRAGIVSQAPMAVPTPSRAKQPSSVPDVQRN